MTDERMALLELIEKGADGDLVRRMLAVAAEHLMEAEVETRTGAGRGVRDPERLAQRNGYRERAWDTRVGRVDLEIPRLRQGSYFPSFLEPRRTAEKALTAVIQEAYVHGVSAEYLKKRPVASLSSRGDVCSAAWVECWNTARQSGNMARQAQCTAEQARCRKRLGRQAPKEALSRITPSILR